MCMCGWDGRGSESSSISGGSPFDGLGCVSSNRLYLGCRKVHICSSSVIAHSVWHSIHTFANRFLEYPRTPPVIAIPASIRFEFQFRIFLFCFILCNKYLLIKIIFCIFFGNFEFFLPNLSFGELFYYLNYKP